MKKLNEIHNIDFFRNNKIKMTENEKLLLNKRHLLDKDENDLNLISEKKILELISNSVEWKKIEW